MSKLITPLIVAVIVLLTGCVSLNAKPLVINEVAVANTLYADENGDFNGWIEIKNISAFPVNLSNWKLSSPSFESWKFPQMIIQPGKHLLIWMSGKDRVTNDTVAHASYKLYYGWDYLLLYDEGSENSERFELDYKKPMQDVIARYPDGSAYKAYYKPEDASPGRINNYIGEWRKLSMSTEFSPRDSSPNACLVYNGLIWIFGGWGNNSGDFHSVSNVWRSFDGIRWEQVTDKAPYNPYSGYAVFNNKMWVIGVETFYSINGEDWTKVETVSPFPESSLQEGGIRVCVFRDKLWAFYEDKIWSSEDGLTWDVAVEPTLWPLRYNPRIIVYKDRMWYIGGGYGYNTGLDVYYNDVWSSEDGINWTLETDNAAWEGRYWFMLEVFNNKLVLMGGWSAFHWGNGYNGNYNDFWYSEDGRTWKQMPIEKSWPPRHASFSFVHKNSLHISSGYGTNGPSTLYNDIWQLPDPNRGIEFFAREITYGERDVEMELYAHNGKPVLIEQVDEKLQILENKFFNTGAGLRRFKATQIGDSVISNTVDSVFTITVNKKVITIKAQDFERPFGEPNPDFALNFSEHSIPLDAQSLLSSVRLQTNASTFSPMGTYDITPESVVSEDENFQIHIINGTLTITAPNSPNQEVSHYLFPNPSTGVINLALPELNDYQRLTIYNCNGSVVFESQFEGNTYQTQLTGLADGLYLYQVNTERGTHSGRLQLFLKGQ